MLLSAPLAQHAESGFLPHGYCYLWNKPLLFTHVTSDVLIGASYVAISFSLALMLRRLKGDIPFSPIFVAFGLFIVACGLTHFVEVWTLWNPVYWLAGGVKVVTAVASVSTAAVLPFVIPMVGRTIREARSAEAQRIASARETAQRESHALLTAVLEAAAEPVYIKDRTGRYIFANTATARVFGVTPDRLVGRTDAELVPASVAERLRHADEQVMAHGGTVGIEEVVHTAEGDPRRFLSSKGVHRDAGGRVSGIFGISRDITEQSRHERELREANARLTALAAELDRANRTKAEFLAAMSHELRTPINAVVGYTDLLSMGLAGPVGERQVEYLDRIKGSARHLSALIEGILDHAKLEGGAVALEAAPADAAALAREAAHAAEALAARKGLRVQVEVPDVPVPVVTDAGRVRQILLNLVSNAVKFTERGSVSVGLVMQDGRVRFVVRDTGIGISPAHVERIFEPFVQVDQSLTRRAEGTGLGLSISRSLARELGGEIVVESAVARGSVFVLALPMGNGEWGVGSGE